MCLRRPQQQRGWVQLRGNPFERVALPVPHVEDGEVFLGQGVDRPVEDGRQSCPALVLGLGGACVEDGAGDPCRDQAPALSLDERGKLVLLHHPRVFV